MSFASLPIVDLKVDESSIIQTILEAAHTTGFFYVRNHDLFDAQQRMFEIAKEFFRLPAPEKEKYSINNLNQGYVRRGQENLDTMNSKLTDEKEAFNLKLPKQPDQIPSLFSEPNNYEFIIKFYRGCFDLCMKLLTYVAQGFKIDYNYFTSRHRWDLESADILRFLHYPAVQKQSGESIRAGAHSDYGSLTLLFQHENRSGLEVLDRSTNIWYPVEPYDDMIVVNFGDLFEYWSNGFVKSIVHRVAMPIVDTTKDNERFSIAYFCHPNDSTVLTPIPSEIILSRKFIKDEHAQHVFDQNDKDVLTAGQHLAMRLSKTYAYY